MIPDSILSFIHKVEGGYVNNPNDPGGATNMGITQRVYDEWLEGKGLTPRDVAQISRMQVNQIYVEKYWVPGQCARISWPANILHFDACVNLGKPEDGFKRSIKILQRTVKVRDDGIFGPVTFAAVEDSLGRTLIEDYCWHRLRYYADITRRRKSLQEFLPGWVIRVQHLRQEALHG